MIIIIIIIIIIIRPKTYRRYVKPQIISNAIYNVIFV
jgi:hypothetical protein